MDTQEANELLPQETTKIISDPRRLKYLLIGMPKWGKTTFLCDIPDSILLAFEEGHAFHETYKIIIDEWDRPYAERKEGWIVDDDNNRHTGFIEAVEAICSSDRFQFVIMDTADMAAKMCLDYHYAKLGVSHAQDAGDYGKGWSLCLTQPFTKAVGKLMKSGRGIGFITHSQVISKTIGKTAISREETTLPSQIQKFLHTQADVIMHGKFGKHHKDRPDRDRVFILDGSNEILAGSRVRGILVPRRFVVDPDHPWKQWAGFFSDPKTVPVAEKEYERRLTRVDVDQALEEPDLVAGEEKEAKVEASALPAAPVKKGAAARRNEKLQRRK